MTSVALPPLIFGMAVVRSKRQDYVSPLDENADGRPVPMKRLFADADLIRQAVALLKSKGFRITTISRFGLYLEGSPEKFAKTFAVALDFDVANGSVAIQGAPSAGVFMLPPDSEYSGLISGISFGSSDDLYGDETPPEKSPDKAWQLQLDELPAMLGSGSVAGAVDSSIKIEMIDTGFSSDHPWFERLAIEHANLFTVTTLTADLSVDYHISDFLESAEGRLWVRKMLPLNSPIARIESYVRDISDSTMDSSSHGTGGAANLLAVVPDANLTVHRWISPRPQIEVIEGVIMSKANHSHTVLSLSVGPNLSATNSGEVWRNPLSRRMHRLMEEAERRGMLVVAAAGNDPMNPPVINYSPIPLIVGSCFRDADGSISAAPTVGYQAPSDQKNRNVPDVCGIGGARTKGDHQYIFCPAGNGYTELIGTTRWMLASGTSLATPQVAGICAQVWSACPAASPGEVKDIVMASAVAVGKGKTGNDFALSEVTHTVGKLTVSAGLAHARRATLLAKLVAAAKARRPSRTAADILGDSGIIERLTSEGPAQ